MKKTKGSVKVSLKFLNKTYKVILTKEQYIGDKSTAIQALDAKDGEVLWTLSVNIPPFSAELPPNLCYFKNWSENEGLLEQLVAKGLIKTTGHFRGTGFVQAPLIQILF